MDKKKQKLINLIKDYGIYEVSHMLGMSLVDIVNQSGMKIDHNSAYNLLFELDDKKELPKEYKGFRLVFSNFDGIVYWQKEDKIKLNGDEYIEDYEFVATPFWDNMPIVPVSPGVYRLLDSNGKIVFLEVFDYDISDEQEIYESQSEFNSVDELKSWFINSYLPNVYDIITNGFIPMMREEAKTFL